MNSKTLFLLLITTLFISLVSGTDEMKISIKDDKPVAEIDENFYLSQLI